METKLKEKTMTEEKKMGIDVATPKTDAVEAGKAVPSVIPTAPVATPETKPAAEKGPATVSTIVGDAK